MIMTNMERFCQIIGPHLQLDEVTQFMAGHFAESMTGNPYTGQPLYLWIKCTKMKAGWLTNTRSPNNIIHIRAAMQNHSKSNWNRRKHTERTPLRLRLDEQVLQDLVACFSEFGSNPFDLTSPKLSTLESAGIEPLNN